MFLDCGQSVGTGAADSLMLWRANTALHVEWRARPPVLGCPEADPHLVPLVAFSASFGWKMARWRRSVVRRDSLRRFGPLQKLRRRRVVSRCVQAPSISMATSSASTVFLSRLPTSTLIRWQRENWCELALRSCSRVAVAEVASAGAFRNGLTVLTLGELQPKPRLDSQHSTGRRRGLTPGAVATRSSCSSTATLSGAPCSTEFAADHAARKPTGLRAVVWGRPWLADPFSGS